MILVVLLTPPFQFCPCVLVLRTICLTCLFMFKVNTFLCLLQYLFYIMFNLCKKVTNINLSRSPDSRIRFQSRPTWNETENRRMAGQCAPSWWSTWLPSAGAAFRALLVVRLVSAFCMHVSDCDETFNYWEPVSGSGTGTTFLFRTEFRTA